MKNNLLQMNGTVEKINSRAPGTPFDPRLEIEEYDARAAMTRRAARERTRKRHMLVVAFGCLAGASLVGIAFLIWGT